MILKIIRDRKSIMNTFFRKDRSRGTKLAGLILCMSLLCVLFSQCVSVVHADDWEIEEGNTQNTQLTSELIGYKDGFSATLYDNSNYGSAAMRVWSAMTATHSKEWIPHPASPA